VRIFRRDRLRWFLALLALAGTVSMAALYAMRSRPVLWAPYKKNETISIGGPSFSILNPFRNRDPERPAETFLNMLKTNECDKAMATLPFTEVYRSYICGKELERRLFSWRMTDREDTSERVKMFYWSRREGSEGIEGPVWVTVQKLGAAWQVTDFECWY
jgi:hypothetical protein